VAWWCGAVILQWSVPQAEYI